MKKLLFYIAAMAMAVGCNDNMEEVGSSEMVDPAVEMVYVELNVEMDGASDTRVSIDPDSFATEWEDEDCIYAYSIAQDKTSEALTYSATTKTFTGDVYPGENRIYYGMKPNSARINFANNNTLPKMVSSEVITIVSGDGSDAESGTLNFYDVYMQNVGAMVELQLTFTNVPDKYKDLKISGITLGGSPDDPDNSFTEGDDYVDIATLINTDPKEDLLTGTFFGTAATTNGAYDISSYTIDDDGKVTIPLSVYPFTIGEDQMLRVKMTVEGDDITDYIVNSTDAEFTVERSEYATITKSVDLTFYNYNDDTWLAETNSLNSFASGSGTESDPYIITKAAELAYLAKIAAGYVWGESTEGNYYKVVASSLDLSSISLDWYPIGTESSPFLGYFDGNGVSITGLVINTTEDYQGLFGYAGAGATIENVVITSPDIEGGNFVGALCGYSKGATISKCSTSGGSVEGYSETGVNTLGGTYIGGLVGANYGTIVACYNNGCAVTGLKFVGGLVGYNSVKIAGCYSVDASVTGNSFIGGLVGYNGGSSDVSGCYYVSSADGEDSAKVSSISALNDKVTEMNSAANTALETSENYFTAGDDDTPPTLTYESSQLEDFEDNGGFTSGVAPVVDPS